MKENIGIINIFILIIISFITGYLICNYNSNSNSTEGLINIEGLINTDETRKKYLSTCCDEGDKKCYDKPPYLQKEQCDANKIDAIKQIDNIFTPQYNQEEYDNKLTELDLKNNKSNSSKDTEYSAKHNERLVVKDLDDTTYNKIINDNNIINGASFKEYAVFNKK